MKRTFVITITVEETTPAPPEPVSGSQSDLSRFVRLQDLPTPPEGQEVNARPSSTRKSPTYMEGRALHPTNADGRQPHLRYGTGRKRHTCSRCGSKGRRLNPVKGVCGLGELCRIMDEKVIE